jgi:hypothetical protein
MRRLNTALLEATDVEGYSSPFMESIFSKKAISAFVADAGREGMVSVVSSIILFAFGVYEHIQGNAVSAYWFTATSVILFWLGAFIAWSKKAQELKRELDKAKHPKIEVTIHDIIIVPRWTQGDCFVLVSLHNPVLGITPDITGYRCCLKIEGKLHCTSEPHSVSKSFLVIYDDDYQNMPHKLTLSRTPMSDLRDDKTPLERGRERKGWLHFTFTGLPQWPSYEEYTGAMDYSMNEETGEPEYFPETELVFQAKTVSSVEVSVTDVFKQWHPATKDYKWTDYRSVVFEV